VSRHFETQEGIPAGQVRVIESIKGALERAGIEFVGTPEDRPGVRLVSKKMYFAKRTVCYGSNMGMLIPFSAHWGMVFQVA